MAAASTQFFFEKFITKSATRKYEYHQAGGARERERRLKRADFPRTTKRSAENGVLANHKYSPNQQNMMKIHKSLWGGSGPLAELDLDCWAAVVSGKPRQGFQMQINCVKNFRCQVLNDGGNFLLAAFLCSAQGLRTATPTWARANK